MTKPKQADMVDTFAPPLQLLVKLGSLAVHADELTQPGAHEVDAVAIRSLLADREVDAWLVAMNNHGFLPLKRNDSRQR